MMSHWDRLDGWAKRTGIDTHLRSCSPYTLETVYKAKNIIMIKVS